MQKVWAIVPAYRPGAALVEQVAALRTRLPAEVVVVDDGSGPAYAAVFAALAAQPGCRVLRHDVNRGKGAALKTAFAYVQDAVPAAEIFITVDADGQHAPDDCCAVVARLQASGADLCLGTRAFTWRTTPFRSWWGNRWTSLAFALRYGRWFGDTQTGLRAFRRAVLPMLLALPGTRYEYEMAVLCEAARRHLAVAVQPIRTIYEAGNASSHYDPLRDTLRVLRALLAPRPSAHK